MQDEVEEVSQVEAHKIGGEDQATLDLCCCCGPNLSKGKDQYVEHDARDAVWLVQDVVLPKVLTHNAKASAIFGRENFGAGDVRVDVAHGFVIFIGFLQELDVESIDRQCNAQETQQHHSEPYFTQSSRNISFGHLF